ncbi:MAG: hypothetical protein ACYTGX_06530 [Planctomycetota bacterium]|jgi:hypothetical protein
MRGVIGGGAVLAACAAVGVVVWWSRAAPQPLPGDREAAAKVAVGPTGPRPLGAGGPTGDIAPGEVPRDPAAAVDPAQARREGVPRDLFSDVVRDSREDRTFHHCVTGLDVPEDIRTATGMTPAEATVVANVLRAEDRRLADALRSFAAGLEDFAPTAEEVAAANGYRMLQMVTAHQPLFLETSTFFQNMNDDTQRAFYEERRPWTDFFQEDTIVIRLCKTVHQVRAESYRQMRDGGVDADTIDKLQARYLLPGHFRYPGNDRFEFGPALQ